ncbi:dihydropyrimidinase [Quadrisphaera sp. INWT6]|uniref:dihydropyrimidinase n=1 Tax=Quadrisphaera sp. INWT6 TaxID=2596917 RepID=UPI0018921272|nr:dihydropyrimidinase [Quadrisphaera sp. INWT6]MBF5081160.1 dihydropyrimidinase [Quadrisphaera sp. INWT6]
MSDLVFHGGQVVSSDGRLDVDLLVRDGRVVGHGERGAYSALDAEQVDCTGRLLLPGGVDTHTHLEHRVASGATQTIDDFHSGTVAAACGGTTTVVDFVRAPPGTPVDEAFHARREAAEASCVVDFGFHPIVPATAGEDDSFARLRRLSETEGVASWKFFMAYPGSMVSDAVLLQGFRAAAELGVLPMVHAENGHMVADAVAGLVAAGRTAEHEHLHGHPASSEAEAVNRAATLARHVGAPLFVVHVSAADAARQVREHRAAGARIWAETCPQYLASSYEQYEGAGLLAAGHICSPPIREAANAEALWAEVSNGTIDTIGTDHASFALRTGPGMLPQKDSGAGVFTGVPNGVPGVEERLVVMHTAGVLSGRISMERFVDLVSTAPARTFGLHPRKGTLAVGADADVVVWDPAAERVLSAAAQHSLADYSVYEQMRVTGAPAAVYSRGELVSVDGEPAPGLRRGRGTYLHRSRQP